MDYNKDRLQKDIWQTTKVDGPNFQVGCLLLELIVIFFHWFITHNTTFLKTGIAVLANAIKMSYLVYNGLLIHGIKKTFCVKSLTTEACCK